MTAIETNGILGMLRPRAEASRISASARRSSIEANSLPLGSMTRTVSKSLLRIV